MRRGRPRKGHDAARDAIQAESAERAEWIAPGQLPPERLTTPDEPEPVEATNYWLEPVSDSRVPYTDEERCAFHREAFAFAKKRRLADVSAQAFADWSVDKIPDGRAPELWILWKQYIGESTAESEDERTARLLRRRKEALNTALRMGLPRDDAEECASGVMEMLLTRGEQPVRFAVIDYMRANGYALEAGRGKLSPTRLRVNHEVEAESLRSLHDEGVDRAAEVAADLRRTVRDLPRHERALLMLHFRWGISLLELAGVFEVTESRVCQLVDQAIRRARRLTKASRGKLVGEIRPAGNGRVASVFRDVEAALLWKRKKSEGVEVNEETKVRITADEPPPFEVKIDEAIPLTERGRREERPEIRYLLDNLKVGQSAELPDVLAKRFASRVKKLPGWKIAQRKGSRDGLIRTWRIACEVASENGSSTTAGTTAS